MSVVQNQLRESLSNSAGREFNFPLRERARERERITLLCEYSSSAGN